MRYGAGLVDCPFVISVLNLRQVECLKSCTFVRNGFRYHFIPIYLEIRHPSFRHHTRSFPEDYGTYSCKV